MSDEHTFGTDSFLLSYYAAPRKHDLVCDLCSGCGIVALLWLRSQNAPKQTYAVDVQEKAYSQMLESARLSGLDDTFTPVLADLKSLGGNLPAGRFNLVTCNPPYKAVNTGVISETESDRIARHETLCTIWDVCTTAKKLLRFGGRLCICQLPERLVDVFAAMRESGIEPKRMRFVQNRSDTAPWLVLVEGKLGAKPFLRVEPPLILREGGQTSEEMKRIYGMYGFIMR